MFGYVQDMFDDKDSNVLAIIDVQEKYDYCWTNNTYMEDLKECILKGKECGDHIFYILLTEDTEQNGKRVPEIWNLVENYGKLSVINAIDMDKSEYIIKNLMS